VPVSTKGQPSAAATRLPAELLPEATGPSMAMAVVVESLRRSVGAIGVSISRTIMKPAAETAAGFRRGAVMLGRR
jgi:hypothetical protein